MSRYNQSKRSEMTDTYLARFFLSGLSLLFPRCLAADPTNPEQSEAFITFKGAPLWDLSATTQEEFGRFLDVERSSLIEEIPDLVFPESVATLQEGLAFGTTGYFLGLYNSRIGGEFDSGRFASHIPS